MLCAQPNILATPETAILPARDSAALHVHGEPRYVTALHGPDAADRPELEQFIRLVFRRAYDADIRHFMPRLMSLRDSEGHLHAVCGLRNAGEQPLFLETYLDEPVENLLAQRIGQPLARDEIVEVGNLAVAAPGLAPHLLAGVSRYLHSTDTRWAVFTAIPVLKNSLTRLNMQIEVLAPARLSRIAPQEQPAWGSYYDKNPQVMAVRRIARPEGGVMPGGPGA